MAGPTSGLLPATERVVDAPQETFPQVDPQPEPQLTNDELVDNRAGWRDKLLKMDKPEDNESGLSLEGLEDEWSLLLIVFPNTP